MSTPGPLSNTDSKVELSTPILTEPQKNALISLLTDDDLGVYQAVRSKILSYGPEASEWLQAHTLSSDPTLRRRAQEIIQHQARAQADNHFLAFCLRHGEDLDVEEGAFLLAQTQYPEINVPAYKALLDCFGHDLREKISGNTETTLATLNQYLFQDQGFHGNEQNYYDPDNSYANRVIDKRTGNPISLCLVYLFMARRLQLPLTGIGMPGHFLCRLQTSTEEIYIDVFNRGKLLTKADCVKYLSQTSHGFQESFLAPISPRRTLLRICSNLHQIYIQLELRDDVSRFQRYIVALAK